MSYILVLTVITLIIFMFIYLHSIEVLFRQEKKKTRIRTIPKIIYKPYEKIADPMFIFSSEKLRF
jgi:hypothetical protein